MNEKFKKKYYKKAYDIITQNYSELAFNLTLIHFLLCATFILIIAYVDSQRGDIRGNKIVYDNLCVMIRKNVQSEIPLID